MRTTDCNVSLACSFMREGVSPNWVSFPNKLREPQSQAKYPTRLPRMFISYTDLCNGVYLGMGELYNLIPREPTISESKLTWCY